MSSLLRDKTREGRAEESACSLCSLGSCSNPVLSYTRAIKPHSRGTLPQGRRLWEAGQALALQPRLPASHLASQAVP